MTKVMTKQKLNRMQKLTNEDGIIDALALDQRGSLVKMMKQAAADNGKPFSMKMVYDFKKLVSQVLSPISSAILLDAQMGFEGIEAKDPATGLIMSYEQTGYDVDTPGRLPKLIQDQSAQIMVEEGADALKVLLYLNTNDSDEINRTKQAFAQRYGTEALAVDVPTFFEVVTYDDRYASDSLEFAKEKPKMVIDAMKEFTQDKYHIDVLKMEVPFNPKFVKEWNDGGEYAYTEEEVKGYLRELSAAATRPFIFLSAGVPTPVFQRELKLAGSVGTRFSGVLSGRATWRDGINVYAKDGEAGLVEWLEHKGTQNVMDLKEILSANATPWYDMYGGKDEIEIIDRPDVK
ncbi:tagatose 1,6-diphosphate aldolase [Lentilactobacillus senioris]|uniref:tagatose 1,6-diphosphate aldolase n=1 Tax=Lentilactobacillus senioris TaxID=931534 RepID=UPI002282F16A|nr:tagatose 1,6-diphosphate aldolase [Lentilactobacillus senioris]MCY9806611.1 tagatose 1,6-diphosphate aldolase [Lentilactobacillus senioris]